MSQPIQRIQFYDKATKKAYDVAAVFEDDDERFKGWKRGIAPEKRADHDAQYPKMLLSDAAARAERGEGRLSLVTPKQRQQQQSGGYDRASPNSSRPSDEFNDDDIPW